MAKELRENPEIYRNHPKRDIRQPGACIGSDNTVHTGHRGGNSSAKEYDSEHMNNNKVTNVNQNRQKLGSISINSDTILQQIPHASKPPLVCH